MHTELKLPPSVRLTEGREAFLDVLDDSGGDGGRLVERHSTCTAVLGTQLQPGGERERMMSCDLV